MLWRSNVWNVFALRYSPRREETWERLKGNNRKNWSYWLPASSQLTSIQLAHWLFGCESTWTNRHMVKFTQMTWGKNFFFLIDWKLLMWKAAGSVDSAVLLQPFVHILVCRCQSSLDVDRKCRLHILFLYIQITRFKSTVSCLQRNKVDFCWNMKFFSCFQVYRKSKCR